MMSLQSVTVVAYQLQNGEIKPKYLNNNTPLTSNKSDWPDIILDLHDAIKRIIEMHFLRNNGETETAREVGRKKLNKSNILKIWFHWYYPLDPKEIEKKIRQKLGDLCKEYEHKIFYKSPEIVNLTRVYGKTQTIFILESISKKKDCHFKTLYVGHNNV